MSIASTAMCWWLTLGEEFKGLEIAGILLIGGGLALLSLFSWAASRRAVA